MAGRVFAPITSAIRQSIFIVYGRAKWLMVRCLRFVATDVTHNGTQTQGDDTPILMRHAHPEPRVLRSRGFDGLAPVLEALPHVRHGILGTLFVFHDDGPGESDTQ